MGSIQKIQARTILDSRGNPTIEVEVSTEGGYMGRASVPSGASTGIYEAVALRDGSQGNGIYGELGMDKAINNVNNIIQEVLIGQSVFDQALIDKLMIQLDGTTNKSKLGGNAIVGVSMAIAQAAASIQKLPLFRYLGSRSSTQLPIPWMNIINGGAHADNTIDIQEYMIVPVSAHSFSEALAMGVAVFHQLRELLYFAGYNTGLGDEGGFCPELGDNEASMLFILDAIEKAGLKPGVDIFIALDAASSAWYDEKTGIYTLEGSNEKYSSDELVGYWERWVDNYPIISIEDGMSENDWDGWKMLTKKLGNSVHLVGDDLFVTQKKRLEKGIENESANSILLKVNQVGTLTETLETQRLAEKAKYDMVLSHRSGETEDTFIADLAVAWGIPYIKAGAPARTDRVAKYNQLLRIEEMLGEEASLAVCKLIK